MSLRQVLLQRLMAIAVAPAIAAIALMVMSGSVGGLAWVTLVSLVTFGFVVAPRYEPAPAHARGHWVGIGFITFITIALMAVAIGLGRAPAASIAATIGASTVILTKLRTRYHVLQYVMFLRFQLLFTALVVGLPLLAHFAASAILGNLFVLDRVAIAVTLMVAGFLIYTVHTTAGLILAYGQQRYALAFSRADDDAARRAFIAFVKGEAQPEPKAPDAELSVWRWLLVVFLFHLVLSAPLFAILLVRSHEITHESSASRVAWALAGVGAGMVIPFFLIKLFTGPLQKWITRAMDNLMAWLKDHTPSGSADEYATGYDHAVAGSSIAVALVTLLAYAFSYFALHPDADGSTWFPPVAYLFIAAIPLLWATSALAFYLDRYRIPAALVIFPLWLFFGGLFDSDHYYEVRERKGETPALETVAAKRLELADRRHKDNTGTAVVITAAGGGIAASVWTAAVLEHLVADSGLPGFADRIVLLSTVSGGSVGSAYFVQGYRAQGSRIDRESIENAARASSLGALGWGIAFPDLLRAFTGAFPIDLQLDRASAIEGQWRTRLACLGQPNCRAQPQNDIWLSDWRSDVAAGIRPAQVLNATVVETGERYIIAPVLTSFVTSAHQAAVTRASHDMRVMTAVRLSATFPYISPVPRALMGNGPVDQSLRAADGGYYDNAGVMTAIEAIDELLTAQRKPPNQPRPKIDRVIFVEIRLAPSTTPAKPLESWRAELLGPQYAMFSVRENTQSERNKLELRLFREKWQCEVEVKPFIFAPALDEDDQPLSWHLSDAQHRRIVDEWKPDADGIADLRDAWKGRARFPKGCPNTGAAAAGDPETRR